jgi:phosphatidylserine decarboxylase
VRIAPEGRPFVLAGSSLWAAVTLAAAVLGGWWWLAVAAWTPIALWVPWFFRDPVRAGPRGDRLAIAPADGKVVSIAEVEEPKMVGGGAVRISVFMNVFDVHVNRHPVSGTVVLREYEPGKFFNATLDKASAFNERASLGVQSLHGAVLVRQIAGLVARRIVTDPEVGAAVIQGERLGMIRFGSRVDTFLPPGVRVLVRTGDRTVAGVTPIAEWP